jgi:hypothetical protein
MIIYITYSVFSSFYITAQALSSGNSFEDIFYQKIKSYVLLKLLFIYAIRFKFCTEIFYLYLGAYTIILNT